MPSSLNRIRSLPRVAGGDQVTRRTSIITQNLPRVGGNVSKSFHELPVRMPLSCVAG